ncbi:hypothetical protein V2J09_015259 [Rumex salicifolius]
MLRFTAALVKRHISRARNGGFCFSIRGLCSQQNPSHDLDNELLVEGKGHCRTVILNRPSALNALNGSMGTQLQKLYKTWEDDPNIGFVMMKGSGRAFCAGGDIVNIYRQMQEGKLEECKEFFRECYTFMYILGTYMKPNIALLNGITMGGGGGISVPGMFRVATEKTVFANPETLIGFHPDAAASFYLSHLPGHLGEYIGLTSLTLSGAEMYACGLATHYSLSAKLPQIEEHLGKLVTDDPSVIENSLQKFCDIVAPDTMSVLRRMETVDKCFGCDTVEEIISSLEDESSRTDHAWCASTVKRLKEVSPLSLKVSLRSIREGRYQTLDQCLAREYRMSVQALSGQVSKDFCEWDPPSLDLVSEDMVDWYSSRLSESEPELELPTKLREAFA